ncbi:alpha/beta fold hydrolase [Nocardia takedensis]|uniref:alpha/beta fold hydrolase n=1 Tax=Nocardia takedensis TaxID=259390 RepID=UPI0003095781|nr:alpha/beta hydrolase [Nocardia takedensis]
MKSPRPARLASRAVAVALAALLGFAGLGAARAHAANLPTIVFVHGAFADASGWREVAERLAAEGYPVRTYDNPLRGPASDAAGLRALLDGIAGPIVLVGHSYGGAVITNTHDPDVRANVYVAAFAPDRGEFVQGLLNPITYPGSRLLPPALQLTPVPDANSPVGTNLDGYIAEDSFHEVFCQDVSPAVAADMYAHQKSAALQANLEPSGTPSWSDTPSWYLVSRQDRVIPPDLQRMMAGRAAPGRTSEVDASHVSLVSRPGVVAEVVRAAATATA